MAKGQAYPHCFTGKMFNKPHFAGGVFMFVVLIRTLVLYALLVVGIRLLGKRQLGELEPSELTLALIIADLAIVLHGDTGTH